VLGALLLAVGLYVFTTNGITSRESDTAAALADAESAERQTGELGAFEDFRQQKQARLQSVAALANGRFDWERLMRELSRVLPSTVYIAGVEASVIPEPDAAPVATDPGVAPGPTAKIRGCARTHPDVAEAMVRLHSMHRVTDVTLTTASKEGATAGVPVEADSGEGCGEFVEFDVTVSFSPQDPVAPTDTEPVPVYLGGGQ
jgi:Tfp pilus assembly protein PilN